MKISWKSYFNIHYLSVKIVILLFLMIYLLGLFEYVLTGFRTDDPLPKMSYLEYIEARRKFGVFPVKVETGMYIMNFPVLDFHKNTITVDAMVWFEFASECIMIETIEQFSIVGGRILYKSKPDIRSKGDRIFLRYNVIFEVKTNLDFKHFPLEDHRLAVIMINDLVGQHEMYFAEKVSFVISDDLFISNWKVHSKNSQAGVSVIDLDTRETEKHVITNPQVMYVINFQKFGIKNIMIIFIPLFTAALLALCSLLFNLGNIIGRITLSCGAVTALLGYRFVLEQIIPKVGYFTTADNVYLFLLIFSFVIFMCQIVLTYKIEVLARPMNISEKDIIEFEKSAYFTVRFFEKLNSGMYIGFVILFLVIITFLIV